MNILYTVLWADNEELPRASFQRLRDAVARGEQLPFSGPYEVALVREPTGQVAVVVLALTATTPLAGDAASSLPEFSGWFARVALNSSAPAPSYDAQPAQHLKLASELGPSALVLENFGTFVGEPDEGAPAPVAAPGMAAAPGTAAPVMVAPGMAAPTEGQEVKPYVAPPPPTASPAAAGIPIPPVAPAMPAQTGLSSGCATALRVTLLVVGILLLVGALCFGSLGVIGYFAPSSNINPQTDTGNFILGMAVCVLPVMLAGGVLVVIGILLPRWLKGKKANG